MRGARTRSTRAASSPGVTRTSIPSDVRAAIAGCGRAPRPQGRSGSAPRRRGRPGAPRASAVRRTTLIVPRPASATRTTRSGASARRDRGSRRRPPRASAARPPSRPGRRPPAGRAGRVRASTAPPSARRCRTTTGPAPRPPSEGPTPPRTTALDGQTVSAPRRWPTRGRRRRVATGRRRDRRTAPACGGHGAPAAREAQPTGAPQPRSCPRLSRCRRPPPLGPAASASASACGSASQRGCHQCSVGQRARR